MGYRFQCESVAVGQASQEFLQHLFWAVYLPTPLEDEVHWSYDCTDWKHPHRAIPLMMAVGALHGDLASPHVTIYGEAEEDVQAFHVEDGRLTGPGLDAEISWPWVASTVAAQRGHPYANPCREPLADLLIAGLPDQRMYSGYAITTPTALLRQLRPALLALNLDPEAAWPSEAHAAIDRFHLAGRTLLEHGRRYRKAHRALSRRGIELPTTLGKLLTGYLAHPGSW